MSRITIEIQESTTNDVNCLRLIGHHNLLGCQELAKRTYNRKTGEVKVFALSSNMGVNEMHLCSWPSAVRESVDGWIEKARTLESTNRLSDSVGRELFASFVGVKEV